MRLKMKAQDPVKEIVGPQYLVPSAASQQLARQPPPGCELHLATYPSERYPERIHTSSYPVSYRGFDNSVDWEHIVVSIYPRDIFAELC